MNYLKFKAPKANREGNKPNKVKDFLVHLSVGFLKKIIPEANPDYEEMIDNVKIWLIEFDGETNFPIREIGLDYEGKVLMVMPGDRNYGYWTDNNLKKEDFENHFETEGLKRDEFNQLWASASNIKL